MNIARQTTAAMVLALVLGGCAGLAVQDATADPETRMAAVADRFQHDIQQGSMVGVIADIGKCYDDTSAPLIKVNALRDCLVLDYTGFQTDRTVGQKLLKGPPLPFLEPATFAPRVDRYAHMAEFKSPAELSKYLTAGYDLVSIRIARMNRGPVVVHGAPPPMLMGR